MKKILLLALPLMVMCVASCEKDNGNNGGDEVIQFNDPNFLKALLVVQEIEIYDAETGEYIPYTMDIDKNKDGQITVNEAKGVKGLDLYDWENNEEFNITDISEIKYFTSLEYLDCEYNQLTSLDLSKNTALTELECSSNQLTSLDISKNTALINLNCDNNQLTSLDLSKNTALNELYCHKNQLTTLNLDKNINLTTLWCQDNQLNALDISQCINLVYLSCDDNHLTTLNLNNNTALAQLHCANNQITSLDVSMCHNLNSISCCKYNNIDNIYYETACPLETLKIYKYHTLDSSYIDVLEKIYGDIIEYVE